MKMKFLAAAAAVFGTVAAQGADLGKYVLPNADAVLASVSDASAKGPYTRAIENAGFDFDKLLADALKDVDGADQAKIKAYLDLLTNGVTRTESVLSLSARPGEGGKPDIRFAAAFAGIPNADKILKKLAADFPETLKLDQGRLAFDAPEVGIRAWVEDGVLRVTDARSTGANAAGNPPFERIKAHFGGKPFAGLRIQDPLGIAERFASAEDIAKFKENPDAADLQKVRNLALFAVEDEKDPVMNITLSAGMADEAAASALVEKLVQLKGFASFAVEMSAQSSDASAKAASENAKALLESVKIESRGNRTLLRFKADADSQIKLIKAALEDAAKTK